MNTRSFFFLLLSPAVFAQTEAPPTPPPVYQAIPRASAEPMQPAGNQRVYGPSSDTLIARQTAAGIIEGFRKVYKTDSAPRIVVYVNRTLVDTSSGMKLTAHSEKYYKENEAVKTSGENTYAVKEAATPSLADRQTVREIERLFGRAFRNGGASLADQATAAALLEDNPGHRLVGDQAAKDREALAKVADVAIEVLISSRNLTMPTVAGDQTVIVPDIQATAIRLKDSAIIGQAAASDILGRDMQAGRIVKQFGVAEITEATALALMEDMLTGKK